MNKYLIVLYSLVFVLFSGKAQTVSVEEAMNVAQNFLEKNQKSAMYCAKVVQQGSDTLLYIFNTDDAFVVVSATKKTIPVLAYSEEGTYNEQEVIPPVAMWLNSYQNQIACLMHAEVNVASRIAKSWTQLLEGGKNQKSNTSEVMPFLRSEWGQGRMYNYFCPQDDSASNNNRRAVTGCVATAMAQLMYYFRFPQSGVGSYSYQHAKYGTLSANFATAKYDYAQMCDAPTDPTLPNIPNAAISLLMSHCGIAVDMVYGPLASGMYNHKAAYALKTYFKYSPQTQYVFRDSTTVNWDSLMVLHLDKKIPLYYAGWSNPPNEGHAFICDGYRKDEQDNYHYHFDFGWNGYQNGYFYTDTLIVGGSNFTLAQELIIHAYPDTANYAYPSAYNLSGRDTLTGESGSFTDGSGIFSNNPANRDFTWVILPDRDTIQSIRFSIHYQLSKNDTIFIETADPVWSNYVFTDTSASFLLNVRGGEIMVRLKTLSGDDASGIFHASYSCYFPVYCNGFQGKPPQSSGTLDDGSGNKKYNNMTFCERRIILNGDYTAINVHFTKFETEKDRDFLYIYDDSKNPKELLIALSGTLENSSYTFNARSLLFVFETDERNVFDGWELVYTGGYVGMQDADAYPGALKIYPNPAHEKLYFANAESLIHAITVFDAMGREWIKITHLNTHDESINIEHLHAGMYFLKVDTKNGTCTRKFVKKQ